jgi:hypothetical protein
MALLPVKPLSRLCAERTQQIISRTGRAGSGR